MEKNINRVLAGRISGKKATPGRRKRAAELRASYESNPRKCQCGKPIAYSRRLTAKFCSRSCAAKVNNIGRRRHGNAARFCKVCNVHIERTRGDLCIRHRIEAAIVSGERTSPYSVRKWLLRVRDHRCELCDYVEWRGSPIPLEVHHVDGDPLNNHPSNLLLICPNCHALTPSFRSKNRGSGRTVKGLRKKGA